MPRCVKPRPVSPRRAMSSRAIELASWKQHVPGPNPVVLACVASESYHHFAYDLMESVKEHTDADFVILDGEEGWPSGTECRHGIFADWLEDKFAGSYDVAFLLDADMLVEEPFDLAEILPRRPGIVATLHPGYIGLPSHTLPYEDRPESEAYVHPDVGEVYYCGGFIGGTRAHMLRLSRRIDRTIRREREAGREVRWHDESVLNRELLLWKPVRTLDPSFAHPDNDAYYREGVWGGREYARKIVCRDKTPLQRVGR